MTLKLATVRHGMGRRIKRVAASALIVPSLVLAGCAGNSGTGGDPGAKPLPPGATCQSIQAELNRMVDHGVQGSVEAQSAGRKISAQQKADADRYNQLLEQYLGARCHVNPTPG